MATLGELAVKVGVNGLDEFTRAMGSMSDRLKTFDRDWNKTWSGMEKVGERLKGFGTNLTVGITAPLGVLAGVSVKAFGDFDAAMTQSLAIMGKVSNQMRGEMADAARQMAKESTFSATQAADAIYFLASAGLDAAASIKALPVVTKFAQAGMFDMSRATDLLVDSQSALGLAIRDDAVANMQNMVRVSDVLVQAANKSNASVEQFAAALTNKAGAALRLVNKDIEEGVAVLAAFADQGTKGEEAGEKLAIVMRDLQNAAIGQKEEFKQFGIQVFDSAGNLRNMADIVQDLEKSLGSMSDEQKRTTLSVLGFQDRSVAALQSLLGFSDEIRRYEAELRKAGGTTNEIADKQLQTFNAQMTLMKNRLTDAAISIGSALVPMLQNLATRMDPVIQFVIGLADAFGKMDPTLQTIIVSLAAVAAAAGPLLFVSGQMITSFAAVAKGIGSLGAAMGVTGGTFAVLTPLAIGLGVAIGGVWLAFQAWKVPEIRDACVKLWQDGIVPLGSTLVDLAKRLYTIVEIPFTGALAEMRDSADGLKSALTDLLDSARTSVQEFNNIVRSLGPIIEGFVQVAAISIKVQMAVLNVSTVLKALGVSIGDLVGWLVKFIEKSADVQKAIFGLTPIMKILELLGVTTKGSMGDLGKSLQAVADDMNRGTSAGKTYGPTLEQLGIAIKNTGDAAVVAGKPIVDLKAHFDALGKKATEAANSYKAVLASYQAGKATLDQVTGAQIRLMQAQDAADPERAAKRQEKAHDEMLERYDKLVEEWIENTKKLKEANEGFADSVSTLAITFGKAHEEMAKKAKEAVEIIVPLNKRLPEGLQDAIKHTKEVSDAYHQLGQKTPGELQRVVDVNRKAWETVKKDAGENSVAALEAWVTMRESEIELARRSGREITRAEEEQLRKAKEQLDQHLGKKEESWKRFTKQVSTIINDLAKDLAAGTVNLLKGLFGFDDFNKKLAADSANLRAELADRSQAIEDFRAEVEESIAGVNSKYADQLASETADLMESLAERRREYATYTLDVAQQIETLRGKEAARLAEEQSTLAEKLRDKEAEYERYVGDVAEKEQEIRRNHEQQLASQLRSLRENLADRVEAYEDFVADANTKLGRIAGDLEESIRDATRSTNRRIEDENVDFARDQEKLNEDLRKAEAKGDKEQVASIRKNLAERQSDHERTVARLREDLAEHTRDARRNAEEQTRDAKLQLERRSRDHAQFIAENTRAQHEVAEKHRIEQAEQLADLQKSLDERTDALRKFRDETADAILAAGEKSAARLKAEEADLQKSLDERLGKLNAYEAEAAKKIDELAAKYAAKQAEEVAALEKGFGDKLREYDKYRTGVEQKLADLEAAHKGPLDRIREMFATVFESATQAVLRLASEEVIGKLLGKLGGLITDVLPGLGKAIAGVLGSVGGGTATAAGQAIGGAVGGAGSAAGGVASAGAGVAKAASGALGMVNAASSVLSAVTDVLSFLGQRHIEKDVAGIEVTTRAIFAEIFNLRADSWDRETHLMGKLDDLWNTLRDGFGADYERQGDILNAIQVKSDDLINAVRNIGSLVAVPIATVGESIEDQLRRTRSDLVGALAARGGLETLHKSFEALNKLYGRFLFEGPELFAEALRVTGAAEADALAVGVSDSLKKNFSDLYGLIASGTGLDDHAIFRQLTLVMTGIHAEMEKLGNYEALGGDVSRLTSTIERLERERVQRERNTIGYLVDVTERGFGSAIDWLKTINATLLDGLASALVPPLTTGSAGEPGAATPSGSTATPLDTLRTQLAQTEADLAAILTKVGTARERYTGDYAPTAEMVAAWNQVLNTAAMDSARLVAVRSDLEAQILSATPIRDRPIVIHNHIHMDSREVGGAIVRTSELAGGSI